MFTDIFSPCKLFFFERAREQSGKKQFCLSWLVSSPSAVFFFISLRFISTNLRQNRGSVYFLYITAISVNTLTVILKVRALCLTAYMYTVGSLRIVNIRDLTQNTTATATRTSRNKMFNEQDSSCARAL